MWFRFRFGAFGFLVVLVGFVRFGFGVVGGFWDTCILGFGDFCLFVCVCGFGVCCFLVFFSWFGFFCNFRVLVIWGFFCIFHGFGGLGFWAVLGCLRFLFWCFLDFVGFVDFCWFGVSCSFWNFVGFGVLLVLGGWYFGGFGGFWGLGVFWFAVFILSFWGLLKRFCCC